LHLAKLFQSIIAVPPANQNFWVNDCSFVFSLAMCRALFESGQFTCTAIGNSALDLSRPGKAMHRIWVDLDLRGDGGNWYRVRLPRADKHAGLVFESLKPL
jgi:hypothetical protein